jgi:hypothetical protein
MDYKLAMISRECSLLGRREVLTGKAKFGIFETKCQISDGKIFKNGDFRLVIIEIKLYDGYW